MLQPSVSAVAMGLASCPIGSSFMFSVRAVPGICRARAFVRNNLSSAMFVASFNFETDLLACLFVTLCMCVCP